MRLKDIPIQLKLLVVPAALLVMMVAVALFVSRGFEGMEQALGQLLSSLHKRSTLIADAQRRATAAQGEMYRIVGLLGTKGDVAQIRTQAESVLDEIDRLERDFMSLQSIGEMSELEMRANDAVLESLRDYKASVEQAAAALESDIPIAIMFIVGVEQSYDRVRQTIDRLLAILQERNQAIYDAALEQADQGRNVTLLIIVAAVFVVIALAEMAHRLISRPLNAIASAMSRLAEGETARLVPPTTRRDEVGKMAKALEVFRESAIRLNALVTELRETQSLLRLVLDTIPIRVFWKDADLRLQGSNIAFARDHGFTSSEAVVGKADLAFGDEAMASAWRSAEAGVVERGETILNRDDVCHERGGTERWLRSSRVPMTDAAGRVVGVLGTYEDVTAVKETERKFLQAQRMQAVGQLTGGIAHDFNNLLNIILGNLDLALDEQAPSAQRSAYLTRATEAAEKGASLVQQLLAYSRRQNLEPQAVRVADLVEETRTMLARALGEMTEFRVDLPNELWPCLADPVLMESALLNLAINARDAMQNGGTFTIAGANRRIDESDEAAARGVTPGDYVELTVTDTGNGIPKELRDHVFEPFFTTKEIGEGSGLGLSMVYGFTKQLGGGVTLESEVGRGTSFRLYLPRSEAKPEVIRSSADGAVPAAEGETILLVEDEPDLRSLTKTMLEGLGYRVIDASDSSDALGHLKSNGAIDLLLSDIIIPGGKNGWQLGEEASALRPALQLLFMSGYAEHGNLEGSPPHDVRNMLKKPFRLAELAAAVRTALAN